MTLAVPTLVTASAPFAVRMMRDDDRGFVGSSWQRAQCDIEKGRRNSLSQMCGDNWPTVCRRLVDRILHRGDTKTRVAYSTQDPDTLFGFAVWTADHLHFVFVRPSLRGDGICKAMLAGAPTLHTCSVEWAPSIGHPLGYRPERSW